MKNIILILIATLTFANANAETQAFEFAASRGRFDGIIFSVKPTYNYIGELWVTLSPDLCYAKHTPLPLPAEVAFIRVGIPMNIWFPSFDSFFDKDAPEGVDLCYVFTGRGMVEGSAWGQRATTYDVPPPGIATDEYLMSASKDLKEGVAITITPRLLDFTDLYVTPDTETCPVLNKPFPFQGRFVKVMEKAYNGYYHLDKTAAYEADLCYFLISKRTGLVINKAWGYRKI